MQKRLVWLENNGYLKDKSITNTRTTRFLMPLVGITEDAISGHCLDMFINAYIKSKKELILFVVLNKLDYPEESLAYIILQNFNENYVEYEENEEEYILEYVIPDHFKDDYNKILEGRYSETSKSYKNIMTRVYGAHTDNDDHLCYTYEVLHPTDEKRAKIAETYNVEVKLVKEVASSPNLDYEIYRSIEQLKTEGFGTK